MKWIAFDIGSYTVQVAVFQNEQLQVKSYVIQTEKNAYYTNEVKLGDSQLSFVSRFIKLYEATDVVFVIPPKTSLEYTSSLYDTARKEIRGDIRFIVSSDATIVLYSYLTCKECTGNNLIIDFGYTKSTMSYIETGNRFTQHVKVFDGFGVSIIDNCLLSHINDKQSSYIYTKQEVRKAREGLSYAYKSFLSHKDGTMCEFNRGEFNEIFDQKINFIESISCSNKIDRIFLTGGGALIPRFTELLLLKLSEKKMNNTRIIRGLITNNGSYHCQTASLTGALLCVLYGYEIKYVPQNVLLKQCSNPYCRVIQSEQNVECNICHVDLEAELFYRCSACSNVVTKHYYDLNNNFCCNCGKHKIQLIKKI